mgnify:CR=1 FL=1
MDLAQKLAEKQDWKAVFEIMYPLALEGNLQAQSNLGMLYNLGRGVDENKELAYWWFSEAAERGSIKAINNLAVMYFNGNNYVKQDTAQAIKLFETSATKDPDAMLTLGKFIPIRKNLLKPLNGSKKPRMRAAMRGDSVWLGCMKKGLGHKSILV